MKKNIILILLLTLLLFTSSCTSINEPTNGQISLELDNLMKRSMEKYKSPGMILAVWVPGKGEYVRAMGVSDINTGRVMHSTDRFRIGSNTKSIVATVVLQLVDEKKLKLEDKLSKFFPKWPNADNITIKMLLNHTSGIYNYSTSEKFGRLLMANPKNAFTPEQLLGYAIKEKPYFAPGKGFHYSNTNTIMLGMIVQKLTQNTLAAEIDKRILVRLGCKYSYFPKGSETNGQLSHGYIFTDKKSSDWTYANVSWGWAAGAMISDIYDAQKIITAITDGTLLSKKLQHERMNSWTPYSLNMMKDKFPTIKYGYNVFQMGGFVGHNGGLPGYVSYMMRDPNTGITSVMMMNSQPSGEATLEVLKNVIQIILPGRKV